MKDYFNYKDKVCVVTGASSGMGKATVEILVELGAKVYALDINECNTGGIEKFIKVDLANEDEIKKAFIEIPNSIDCYFGIAGLSGSITDYKTTFNVNYTANAYITEVYLKERMSKGGSILYVTSTAGIAWKEEIDECKQIIDLTTFKEVNNKIDELIESNTPSILAYMYSKRCMNAYSNKIACVLGKNGIRVNNVLPGSTDTGMKDEFAQMAGGLDNMIKAAGLANRLATSEEMALPIVFLNSDMANFISGIDLIIDYADNALKIQGIKKEQCSGPAIIKLPK